MRKLLLFCILGTLSCIPARSSLSFSLYPEEKIYLLSVAQQSQGRAWDGQVAFAPPDKLTLLLPARFKIGVGGASLCLGYAGFWQQYALLPFFSREQALLYQGKESSVMVLSGDRQAIGYDRSSAKRSLSLLAWRAPKTESSSFQTQWGAEHARWGVAAKLSLRSSFFSVTAETLFTPVKGVEAFIASSLQGGPATLGFSYGKEPYPTRYSLALALGGKDVKGTFAMEDWFGAEPRYGGHSSMRKREQKGSIHLSLARGYLHLSASDTFEFKRKGSTVGSVVLLGKWVGSFGELSIQYKQERGAVQEAQGVYRFTLGVHKATLTYSKEGYEIALTDSLPLGKGVGTVRLHKRMGSSVTLSLLYTLTSDR